MCEYSVANGLLRECERQREAGLVPPAEYRATRRYIITALEAGNGDLAGLAVAAEAALPDATLPVVPVTDDDRQEPVMAAPPAIAADDEDDDRDDAQEYAETAGMPERSVPSGPMDRHTFTMVMILVGALVIAIGMLGYVLAL